MLHSFNIGRHYCNDQVRNQKQMRSVSCSGVLSTENGISASPNQRISLVVRRRMLSITKGRLIALGFVRAPDDILATGLLGAQTDAIRLLLLVAQKWRCR